MRQTELSLNKRDRRIVDEFRSKGLHMAREFNRAHILAALDRKMPEQLIMEVLNVGRTAVWRTRAAYLKSGLDFALHDEPRPGKPKRYAADAEAQVTALACSAMIKLSRDSDRDVRDWATFTLAKQFDSDSPALRSALEERLVDSGHEIRGEALVGLARRRYANIAQQILRELQGDFHGDSVLEAAGLLADVRFLPALEELDQRITGDNAVYFRGTLRAAIAACEGRHANDSSTLQ